jgi:hypothetical protein
MKNRYKFSAIIVAFCSILALSCVKTGGIDDLGGLPAPRIFLANADRIMVLSASDPNKIYSTNFVDNKLFYNIGVGRSGIERKEAYSVDITVNNDTINKLITSGVLQDVELLPANMYTIDTKISIGEGEDVGKGKLVVDLSTMMQSPTKTFAIAFSLANPSRYEVNKKLSTVILTFKYDRLVPNPTFVDDLSSGDFTSKYVTIGGGLNFTPYNPAIMYDDSFILRRAPGTDQAYLQYNISGIKNLIPGADALTGYKINMYNAGHPADQYMTLSYSKDNGLSFQDIKDYTADDVFIAEKGEGSWHNVYLQGALADGVTNIRFTFLVFHPQAFWLPSLGRVELFYKGGVPYKYEKP